MVCLRCREVSSESRDSEQGRGATAGPGTCQGCCLQYPSQTQYQEKWNQMFCLKTLIFYGSGTREKEQNLFDPTLFQSASVSNHWLVFCPLTLLSFICGSRAYENVADCSIGRTNKSHVRGRWGI